MTKFADFATEQEAARCVELLKSMGENARQDGCTVFVEYSKQ